jgi:glutamate-1-semialdehyde aminotransferase
MPAKKTKNLWDRAKKIIPGGTQLLSKRPEQFLPGQWPVYFKKAKGCEVWDLDGNKYIDTWASVGACILGYADPDVNSAVKKAVEQGNVSTLNCPEELELAELLLKLHPWAEQARFARCGGEAMAIAVRIARAYTGKDKVAFCGYHGWHDWYLSANLSDDKNLDGHLIVGLSPRGVPRGLKGTSMPFHYNKIEELEKIVSENNDLAAIVLEPVKNHEPENNFLQKAREIATKCGAVLIFDEITIGWRLVCGGAHLVYKVNPDIAVFAKGMSNGFAMAAIIGKKNVMEASQSTFISSSYWTERTGPAAALASIKKMIKNNVPRHLYKTGKALKEGIKKSATAAGLKVQVYGLEPLVHFDFLYGEESLAVRTLFTQEMLKRGILASGAIYLSYALKDVHAKKYLSAVNEVFPILADAIENKKIEKLLKGPVAQKGFQRLT